MNPSEFNLHKAAYSVNETLNLLSLGRTTLYLLVKDGELTPTKFGKRTLFSAPDLAAMLSKRRVQAGLKPSSRTKLGVA